MLPYGKMTHLKGALQNSNQDSVTLKPQQALGATVLTVWMRE